MDSSDSIMTPKTPEKANISEHFADTPVGDRDSKPKVQMCVELREQKIKGKSVKKFEVTVLGVKNLPKIAGRVPIPFVKLRMIPDELIFSTELKANKKDDSKYSNVDIFEFPIGDKIEDRVLNVQVCDRKITRNAKIFGAANISVSGLKIGKPIIQWHELQNNSGEE